MKDILELLNNVDPELTSGLILAVIFCIISSILATVLFILLVISLAQRFLTGYEQDVLLALIVFSIVGRISYIAAAILVNKFKLKSLE